tara:strand:+ start:268 stop:558 length:291 start_codon:yes stop_codon:yes gene_type:complete
MYVITVEFIIKADHIANFKKRMLQQAYDSLQKEKDCYYFDVCLDKNNMSKVFLYEIYKDEDAFNVHLTSSHYINFNKEVSPWVLEKNINKFEKQEL